MQAFSDVAPLPPSFSAELLCRIGRQRLPGIIQASAKMEVTYEQAAHYIARRLGAKGELVQGVQTRSVVPRSESLPALTTLDISRMQSELGLEPPDVCAGIASLFEEDGKAP